MNFKGKITLSLLSALAFQGPGWAQDPFKDALRQGIFQHAAGWKPEPPVLPLPPQQRLEAMPGLTGFRITGTDPGAVLPLQARPGEPAPKAPADLPEEGGALVAAVDLTGSGVSDLVYARPGAPGWRVLSNASRLPKPAPGFAVGLYDAGAESARAELIPADTSDLRVDHDLLAAVGDFLGTGTEQLAYTRPGQGHIWVVGAHGVTALRADLRGIEGTPAGPRSHWLFAYRSTARGQRTRLAYYRAGATHLIRLVPKGMEFVQEQVPLKGHWHRLNQAELDWPKAAGVPGEATLCASPEPEPPAGEHKAAPMPPTTGDAPVR